MWVGWAFAHPHVRFCLISPAQLVTFLCSCSTSDFVFWHLPQLQHKNPDVQFLVFKNMTPTPFMKVYFGEFFFHLFLQTWCPFLYWGPLKGSQGCLNLLMPLSGISELSFDYGGGGGGPLNVSCMSIFCSCPCSYFILLFNWGQTEYFAGLDRSMSSHTPHGSFDCLHLLQIYLCGCFLVFEGKLWFGAQFIYKNLRLALFADNKNNCLIYVCCRQ